jgi:hypothetical protein
LRADPINFAHPRFEGFELLIGVLTGFQLVRGREKTEHANDGAGRQQISATAVIFPELHFGTPTQASIYRQARKMFGQTQLKYGKIGHCRAVKNYQEVSNQMCPGCISR